MMFLTVLHILNIVAIMSLAFYVRHIQGSKPYSLFWSVIFFICCLSSKGLKWFINHPIYLVRQLLFAALTCLYITLIGQLMDSNIFHEPIFVLMLSPLSWSLVLLYNYYTEQQKTHVSH